MRYVPVPNYSIRLTDEQRAELRIVAARLRVEPADLIRFAIDGLLKHIDYHGGKILLPVDLDLDFSIFPQHAPLLHAAEEPGKYSAKSSGSKTTSKKNKRTA